MPDAETQPTGTSRADQIIAQWRQAAEHHDTAQAIACLADNVVLISEYLTQVMDPADLEGQDFAVDQFKVFAIKSRVHFRRGFDDSGFARTILLVEPIEPFLGTVRLDALPYKNVDVKKFYPYGDVSFP